MFAVVANGIQTICKTQRALGTIIALYPYPKFQKCSTYEEAREWIRKHSRTFTSLKRERYGDVGYCGYARIEYFIVNGFSYYNIYTRRVGQLRIDSSEYIHVDNRRNLIKVKITDTMLDDDLIQHHVIAITRILKLLGGFVDVDVVVPDVSIYLALTKYSGNDYVIRSFQRLQQSRLGGFSVTVRERGEMYN